MNKILILPGDGIGPEIIAEALKILACLKAEFGLAVEWELAPLGGAGFESAGDPLPAATLALAQAADAVLMGAVGGPQWDGLPRPQRPEQGLLRLRAGLGVFANLRPAQLYPALVEASTLRPEVVAGLDIIIVRELVGDVYFGQPRSIQVLPSGEREGLNTMRYRESEVARIAHVAFQTARQRNRRLCSVDKANVLESSEVWRQVVTQIAADYPDVQLSHMYVDNAAMQLVRAPKQFDVIVTGNLFGDILSDCAAMLTGSIGMLPSAALDARGKGLYEPIHGSAPDIAGQNKANPLATILSLALLLRYSLRQPALALRVERAVEAVVSSGLRTADIAAGGPSIGTVQMGNAVLQAMRKG